MPDSPKRSLKVLGLTSSIIFYLVTISFVLISIMLICLAFYRLWQAVTSWPNVVITTLFESIGFTTIAAAVFELAKTIYDEEIASMIKMDHPGKIRHFMSRFLTVIIISLCIEFLTMVFRFSHNPVEYVYMFESAAVAVGIALIFASWAYFNKISEGTEKWERKIVASGKKEELD
ncbi:MAG: hypothetical protein WBZ29_03420 [Methanocella sp.]